MGPGPAWHGVSRALDAAVAGTPAHRDRYVDLLRLLAIGVVVVWHWSLSVLYWSEADAEWVMPNPIHAVPGSWLATWLLQIMPLFFLIGGYANAAAWQAARRSDRPATTYYGGRLRRLLVPVAVFLAVWAVIEFVAYLAVPGYRGVVSYALIVFIPLWFVAAYLWVVVLVPVTATAHARARWAALAVLAAAVVAAELGRFGGGIAAFGWVNTALVWVLIHQLGYFFRDFCRDHYHEGGLTRSGRWIAAGIVVAAIGTLAALTALDAYPASMVATVGQERSNILPTTVPIAVVAVLQLGVAMLLRAPATRWLRRPAAWKPVVAGNAVIMTVFLWHMAAVLVVLVPRRGLGVGLPTVPTAGWWLERPFWLVAPLPVLAVLVAIFGWFEVAAGRRPRGKNRAGGERGAGSRAGAAGPGPQTPGRA